ncbi:serine hydrolase domain-containing protein [Agarivorans gilvus]|uniref:serine hydrolase domain-containing protein n=1 Tax=Agarivorans gilvus TaxID=680279 RepID=UPI0006EC0B4D|nr:serine hydrolase domain-containing protein [Agarivorans gilvus]
MKLANQVRQAILRSNAAMLSSSLRLNARNNSGNSEDHLNTFSPGAKATLPVAFAKQGFSAEFSEQAHHWFSPEHFRLGGDHALYYHLRLHEFLPTALCSSVQPHRPLDIDIQHHLGQLLLADEPAGLNLENYIIRPEQRVQGLMMVHQGKVVYQAYPGMQEHDLHVWFSMSQTLVTVVIGQLILEGKIELDATISYYLPRLMGSNWDRVSLRHALNMSTGLDVEDGCYAHQDLSDYVTQFHRSKFAQASSKAMCLSQFIELIAEAEPLPNENVGQIHRSSSIVSCLLMHIAEKLEQKTWADIFSQRVWGKLNAARSMYFALRPESNLVAQDLALSTLEDAAKFALQFTPSWQVAAAEQIVNSDLLALIYSQANAKQAFALGRPAQFAKHIFNQQPITNAFQFDGVFEDGAMYKLGLMGQGMYIDPARDFVGVYFSSREEGALLQQDRMLGYFREAAKQLAGSKLDISPLV